MKKLSFAVAVTAAALTVFTGCGKKTATPTPSANVPVVSETPAIESPDMSALVSPETTITASPVPSPITSTPAANSPTT